MKCLVLQADVPNSTVLGSGGSSNSISNNKTKRQHTSKVIMLELQLCRK
jgi:hypothetical protein